MSEEPVTPAEDPDPPLTDEDVARLDQEGDGPGDDTPPEPPEPPETTPPASDMAAEETFKKLEAAGRAHRTKVGNILSEESYGLIDCPLCIASPVPGMVNLADAGNLHPEHLALVNHFLGISREIEYAQDPERGECPTCHGEGKTQTGSKVPQFATHDCSECRGFGYVPPPTLGVAADANGATHELTPADFAPPQEHADVDNWGEPRILPDGRENPNYGRQPQFKIPVPPWGVTANLTAQDVAQ